MAKTLCGEWVLEVFIHCYGEGIYVLDGWGGCSVSMSVVGWMGGFWMHGWMEGYGIWDLGQGMGCDMR